LREAPKFSQLSSNLASKRQSSLIQTEVVTREEHLARGELEKTGSFNKEDDLSQSEFVESKTNPELTTTPLKLEKKKGSDFLHQGQLHPLLFQRLQKADASVGVHICCHEQAKQHAVVLQKVQFLNEQLKEEKSQSQMKEQQYSRIIAALKQTAEENFLKHGADNDEAKREACVGLSKKEMQDTFDELNAKKQEVNNLQEQVLELEIKMERKALDFKITLQ